MKASETTLRNLLEGTKQFQIPFFQRPYSWRQENWQTLWEDLIRLYNNEVEGSYFLGAIVTQGNGGTADGISPYLVIDGQQRLITLTILLAAMRSHLLEEDNPKLKDNNQKLAEELYDTILTNKDKNGEDFYKILLPTQRDREIFHNLINDSYPKLDLEEEGLRDMETKNVKHLFLVIKATRENKKYLTSRIYECQRFFKANLKRLTLDLAKIKDLILERLILVNITSDDKDNAFLIFESLNSKGQALTQADLVRNYIFMQLPVDQREEIYTWEWLPLEQKFIAPTKRKFIAHTKGEAEYADELTKAFWFYLRKDGGAITEKDVYQTLKKRFDASVSNDSNGIVSKLKELIKFANYYHRLNFFNNEEEEEEEEKLRRWFKRLDRLDFTTCHIFLLNVYDEYEQGKISLEKFEKILCYLESYFVRRWFAKVSTKILGNLFPNLYAEVKSANANDLVEGLQTVLSGYEKEKGWPTDGEFRQGILNTPIYRRGDNDRVKLILESLADYRSKEPSEKYYLTIEHIMPQTLDSEWESTLGANFSAVHKKYLHTLGNLTLTGYNPELSNKPFDQKRMMYIESSNFSLNKYLKNIDTWNADQIQKRANHLADIAIKIWPRP